MVTSLLLEDPPAKPSIVFFYPLGDLLNKLDRVTDVKFVIDHRVQPNKEWS